ncbi:hypothetical protein HDE_12157 [Halotydeus destructor]|nr:hypothetical protein HDE_12157 [Halotydeus destructor]
MTPNDHFQCGRQGSLHAVGQHHSDHVPWCNKGYCAVIRYCEDENRLRHRPSFLITSYSFPWQHTCPGLWQIDYNHQIMLEKIPGIEEIVVSLNEDFRHTLTNAQQNSLKALNYNVYFVDFEDGYNFAFVMAPERIMMELRPEALDNFVEQVTQLYGRSVGDLSLIFKKLVDHGQYDVRAVAVETTNVHGRTMPFRDLKYKKITSIEVLPKFSNFTREAKRITVSNEVIFCLSSKAKYISRQALKWFGHGKELFPNAERIDEPICFQVAAGQLDRVSTFIRYDRSLLGGHVRNLMRFTQTVPVMMKLIANGLLEDIKSAYNDGDVSRLRCESLDIVPYSFWMNTSKAFVKELKSCLEAGNIIMPRMPTQYQIVGHFIDRFRESVADELRKNNNNIFLVKQIAAAQGPNHLRHFVTELKETQGYTTFDEVFRNISMRPNPNLAATHTAGRLPYAFRSYALHHLGSPRARSVMALLDHFMMPYVPDPPAPATGESANEESAHEDEEPIPATPHVTVNVQVPGSSAENQAAFERWSQGNEPRNPDEWLD